MNVTRNVARTHATRGSNEVDGNERTLKYIYLHYSARDWDRAQKGNIKRRGSKVSQVEQGRAGKRADNVP